VSHNAVGSSRGWYLDLISPNLAPNTIEGEMQVTDSVVNNGQVFFTTLIPNSDPCSGGGRSWLMALDVRSGGTLDTAPFDLNGDGSFNSGDSVTLSDGTKVVVTGLGSNGIGSKPTFLSTNDTASSKDPNSTDLALLNNSSGVPDVVKKNPGPRAVGRQSWRQVR
jgi:type IV pilus assembly protein PilY1